MAKKKQTSPMLLLRCGCSIRFRDGQAPVCPSHGNQPVARVLGMRKPSFRGSCKGPLAKTEDLGTFTGRLVGSET